MASTITAGNATNGLALSCDNTGILELKTGTGSGTTAITADASQNVTVAGTLTAPSVIPSSSTAPTNGVFLPAANTLGFSTASTERARIDTSGNLLVGKTVTTSSVNGIVLNGANANIEITSPNDAAYFYRKTSTGGNGVILTYSDVGGTRVLVGAGFANGTFGTASDANKKKNIEDARSYLDDVMRLRVVKYNWKTDEDNTPKELGWIAQEVEQVFPGMVSDMDGTKLVKKEVFLPMLMKCIQEQQQMIEELKAEVAALKGAA